MKKIISFILATVLTLSLAACGVEPEEPKEPDWMQNYWGDSQKKVIDKAGEGYAYAADDVIMYEDYADGVMSEIYYQFTEGKLTGGIIRYATGEDDFTLEKCIELYNQKSEELTQRYGAEQPSDRIDGYRIIDKNAKDYEEHQNDEDKYLIFYHILSFLREWNDGVSEVNLSLDYSSNRVNMLLEVRKAAPAE